MIMKKTNIYTKNFSEINSIQSKKIIKYYICEENICDTKIYGISILEIGKSNNLEKTFNYISFDYCLILNILKFLYENSIGILNFKDVVKDILCNIRQNN